MTNEKDLNSSSQLNIETHSIDFIPHNERNSKLSSQGPFWFLGNFHFFTISIGFIGVSMGLSALWTFIAGALGIMFGTIFMAFHGSQGPEMGLPQMIQSRAQFGYRGVILVLFATLFVFVGFNVVNVTLLMNGLSNVFGTSPLLICIVSVLIGALLSIYGHDLMHKCFKWALIISLPVYALLSLAAIFDFIPVQSAINVSSEVEPSSGFSWVAFATQFAIAASYNISYAPYVSDYSRYLPKNTSRTKLVTVVFLGASISGAWMMGLGAWMAEKIQAQDALTGLAQMSDSLLPNSGVIVVALAAFAFLPIIALNTYSAMLTLLTGIDSIKSIKPTQSARTLAIVLISLLEMVLAFSMSSQNLGLLHNFLMLMLYFLIPWTAVNLVDYFFVRKGHYAIRHFFQPKGIYGEWNTRGISSYLIGFAAMIPFLTIFDHDGNPVFVGFIAEMIESVDIAWLVGLLVSGIAYYILSRSIDIDKERRFIAQEKKDYPDYA